MFFSNKELVGHCPGMFDECTGLIVITREELSGCLLAPRSFFQRMTGAYDF